MSSIRKPTLWTGREIAEVLGQPWRSPAGEAVIATGLSGTEEYERGDLVLTPGGPAAQAELLTGGAAAVLTTHPVESLAASYPVMHVEGLDQALFQLAKAARRRATGRFAAVTGTVGKTWLKDVLNHVLGQQGETVSTRGNRNGARPVAFRLGQTARTVRFGVYELGMTGPGSIDALAAMVQPHVAIVSAISTDHMGKHSSIDSVVATKSEIYAHVASGGTAIWPADSDHGGRLREAAERGPAARVLSFGRSDDADVRLVEQELSASGSRVVAEVEGERHEFRVRRPGSHEVMNSLGAIAVAHALGADWRRAADDIHDARFWYARGKTSVVRLEDRSFTLIDASYKAVPVSMRAYCEVLSLHSPRPGASRVVVTSDMFRQGSLAKEEHARLAPLFAAHGVDLVITAGDMMREYLRPALAPSMRGPHCETPEELREAVIASVRSGDVVLFHGVSVVVFAEALRLLRAMPQWVEESNETDLVLTKQPG